MKTRYLYWDSIRSQYVVTNMRAKDIDWADLGSPLVIQWIPRELPPIHP